MNDDDLLDDATIANIVGNQTRKLPQERTMRVPLEVPEEGDKTEANRVPLAVIDWLRENATGWDCDFRTHADAVIIHYIPKMQQKKKGMVLPELKRDGRWHI
jgi:uncharacterized protein YihD (DUF1040 family)